MFLVNTPLKTTLMKKLIIALAAFVMSFSSNAQSDSLYLDLGVNAIRLVNFGMNNSALDYDVWNPYMLTANVNYKRLGLRVGLGLRSGTRNELPTDANGKTTVLMDTSRVDLRIGLGWEVALAPKWTFKFGADYFTASESNLFETEFTNENNEKVITTHEVLMDEKGISPFVAVQYHITPRVSLGTELLWRMSSYTSSNSDTSNLNDADIVRKYEGNKSLIMAPTALFLNFRF